MAKAKAPVAEEPKHDWLKWALGIAATLVTALVLWIVQFLVFGFEEYVKDVAAKGTVPVATQTQIDNIESSVGTLVTQVEAEAERNREFREEQREDMRNLVRIISGATP